MSSWGWSSSDTVTTNAVRDAGDVAQTDVLESKQHATESKQVNTDVEIQTPTATETQAAFEATDSLGSWNDAETCDHCTCVKDVYEKLTQLPVIGGDIVATCCQCETLTRQMVWANEKSIKLSCTDCGFDTDLMPIHLYKYQFTQAARTMRSIIQYQGNC